MIWAIPFCLAFALLNRARGTRLFDDTNSTVIGRLISMCGMSFLVYLLFLFRDYSFGRSFTALMWTWVSLILWATPAWDNLWSMTIGHDPTHSRLYGLAHFGLRMALGAPCIIGLAYLAGNMEHAWVALFTPLLAVPYYVFGYLTPDGTVIRNSELAAGAMWGGMVWALFLHF